MSGRSATGDGECNRAKGMQTKHRKGAFCPFARLSKSQKLNHFYVCVIPTWALHFVFRSLPSHWPVDVKIIFLFFFVSFHISFDGNEGISFFIIVVIDRRGKNRKMCARLTIQQISKEKQINKNFYSSIVSWWVCGAHNPSTNMLLSVAVQLQARRFKV